MGVLTKIDATIVSVDGINDSLNCALVLLGLKKLHEGSSHITSQSERNPQRIAHPFCWHSLSRKDKKTKGTAAVNVDGTERNPLVVSALFLLQDLTEYQKKCQGMQAEEMALRHQLSMYTDKYDDFQKALAQSNRTFGGFKEQMDAMTKKLKNLEKETQTWKQRWEKSNKALMDMAGEKQSRDASLAAATKQVAQLEKLCRALQTERQTLIAQLKQKSVRRLAALASFRFSRVSQGRHAVGLPVQENTQPEETLSADSTATELESADETVEVAAAAPESATQEPVAAGEATPEADPSSTVSESAAETVEEPVPVVESTVQPLKADVDSAETCAEASPVPPSTAAAAESIVPTVETAAEEAEPTGESAESSSPVAESVPEPAAEAGEGRPAEEGEQPAASLNLDQAEASSQ